MHAKYVSNGTSTQAQVINDIALLLSGSNIAALSASCDKVNSTLISTVAPGWTLSDAAAGGNGCVLTAPDANALTTKYARIFGPAGGTIDVWSYETWNSGTHTGTNPTTAHGITLAYSAVAVNTYWIFATPRGFFICSASTSIGALEISRDASYLNGTTYPCLAALSAFGLTAATLTGIYLPRMKNLTAAGDLTTTSAVLNSCSLSGRTGQNVVGAPGNLIRDNADVSFIQVMPIWAGFISTPFAYNQPAMLGKFYDVYEVMRGAGNAFDTFISGADTYMIVPGGGGTCTIAFKVA